MLKTQSRQFHNAQRKAHTPTRDMHLKLRMSSTQLVTEQICYTSNGWKQVKGYMDRKPKKGSKQTWNKKMMISFLLITKTTYITSVPPTFCQVILR